MDLTKKSLCVFIHFGKTEYIPKYVEIYINELSLHFDEVIFVLNKRRLNTDLLLLNKNITSKIVKNEGYDLGMFYKVFQTINPADYRQIACINDSNILFRSLDPVFNWSTKQDCDFWGIIDSYEHPWFSTHENTYHLQSHFIVFNERAIEKLSEFFKSIHIDLILKEKNIKLLRRTVINEWEIGLTQYMIKNGLTTSTYISSKSFSEKYNSGKIRNVSQRLYPQLIKTGYPLLKKKIIFDRIWKERLRFQPSWKKLVIKFGQKDWEIKEMVHELMSMKTGMVKKLKFNILRLMKKL